MVPNFTGTIVEWDRERGCGWVDTEGQRIFLHWRDFAERRKRPEVGDVIRFIAGTGPNGGTCARDAVHLSDGGRFGCFAMLLLGALVILPGLALAKVPLDPRFVGGYAVAISVVAYCCYAYDKAQARSRRWRVSEATLHFLELIGGWPGAFIAQRRLRHKCSKRSYQVFFWLVVLLYQFAALDFLEGGRFSKAIAQALRFAK